MTLHHQKSCGALWPEDHTQDVEISCWQSKSLGWGNRQQQERVLIEKSCRQRESCLVCLCSRQQMNTSAEHPSSFQSALVLIFSRHSLVLISINTAPPTDCSCLQSLSWSWSWLWISTAGWPSPSSWSRLSYGAPCIPRVKNSWRTRSQGFFSHPAATASHWPPSLPTCSGSTHPYTRYRVQCSWWWSRRRSCHPGSSCICSESLWTSASGCLGCLEDERRIVRQIGGKVKTKIIWHASVTCQINFVFATITKTMINFLKKKIRLEYKGHVSVSHLQWVINVCGYFQEPVRRTQKLTLEQWHVGGVSLPLWLWHYNYYSVFFFFLFCFKGQTALHCDSLMFDSGKHTACLFATVAERHGVKIGRRTETRESLTFTFD